MDRRSSCTPTRAADRSRRASWRAWCSCPRSSWRRRRRCSAIDAREPRSWPAPTRSWRSPWPAAAVAFAVAPSPVAYLMATLAATSITLVRPAHAALLPEVAETPDRWPWRTPRPGRSRASARSSVRSSPGCSSASAEPAAVYAALALLTLASFLAVLPLARAARPLVAPMAIPRRERLRSRAWRGPAHDRRRPPAPRRDGDPERRDRAPRCVQRPLDGHRHRPARGRRELDRLRRRRRRARIRSSAPA